MKRITLDQEIPDIEIVDRIAEIRKMIDTGKKLTSSIVADKLKITRRVALQKLDYLENEGILKSTMQPVNTGRQIQLMRVFEKVEK